MFLLEYIDPLVFMLALFVGLAYTYFTTPAPKILIKYPTPFNIKDTIYRDTNGVCYKYLINEVPCPQDKSKITFVKDPLDVQKH